MDTPDSAASAGRGVGPSLIGHLIRDRSLRLAGGLAIAVAIPVAVLFYFQFRSIDDLGRSSAVVLRQLSQETADGVTRKIEDTLKAPYINVLLRTPQAQSDPLNLAAIEPTFEQGLGDDAVRQPVLRLVGRLDRAPGRAARLRPRERGLPLQPARSRRSSSSRFRELAPQKRAISVFEATIDGRRTLFPGAAAVRVPGARQDDQLRRVPRRRRAAAHASSCPRW